VQRGEYDQAEQFLLKQYEEIKTAGERTALRHILHALAMFYRLPFKMSLSQAAVYYRELEVAFPGRETDLELASFYFHKVKDFAKTVDRIQSMGRFEDQDDKDVRFYYTALTLKGRALLQLNRQDEAATVLQELARIVASSPKQVPYGDEFNFLNEMTQKRLEPELCKQLAKVVVARIKDQEFKSKFLAMLNQLES
jgi:hypothetical protein